MRPAVVPSVFFRGTALAEAIVEYQAALLRHLFGVPLMLFALGAASSVLDALQSLATTKSSPSQSTTSSQGASQGATSPFDFLGTSGTTTGAASGPSAPGWSRISPETMSALIAAQSQSGSATASSTNPSDALQDLFSQIDADGSGQISKSEFENALGAGGTNLAQADDVFAKLDQDGDGSVSLDEMKSALQGASGHHGGHHHHARAAGADGTGDPASANGTSNTDPLLQALNAQTAPTSLTGAGSTSPYDLFDQLMQRQAQSFSSATSAALSV